MANIYDVASGRWMNMDLQELSRREEKFNKGRRTLVNYNDVAKRILGLPTLEQGKRKTYLRPIELCLEPVEGGYRLEIK